MEQGGLIIGIYHGRKCVQVLCMVTFEALPNLVVTGKDGVLCRQMVGMEVVSNIYYGGGSVMLGRLLYRILCTYGRDGRHEEALILGLADRLGSAGSYEEKRRLLMDGVLGLPDERVDKDLKEFIVAAAECQSAGGGYERVAELVRRWRRRRDEELETAFGLGLMCKESKLSWLSEDQVMTVALLLEFI